MAKEECIICGEEHPRCNAHKTTGDPCMRWPRDTEPVCQLHGGNTPQVRRIGVERRAIKAIEADVSKLIAYDLDGTVPDPLALVEGMVASEVQMMQALGARVNAERKLSYESNIGTEQLKASVILYERSRDRVMKYTEVLLKHKPDGEAVATVNLLTSLSDRLAGIET